MVTVHSSEKLVDFYQTIKRHVPATEFFNTDKETRTERRICSKKEKGETKKEKKKQTNRHM
jgi:hypothetical protein